MKYNGYSIHGMWPSRAKRKLRKLAHKQERQYAFSQCKIKNEDNS